MGVSEIAITLTSLIGIATCQLEIMSVEMSLPDIVDTVRNLDKALKTVVGAAVDDEREPQSPAEKLFMKVKFNGLANIARIMQEQHQRRDNQMRPSVELGPGAFKSEILTYPSNYFVNRLKTLIKIKEKEEAKNKNA